MSNYILKEHHTTDTLENKVTRSFDQNFRYLEKMVIEGDLGTVDNILEELHQQIEDLQGDAEKRKEEIQDEHDKRVKQGMA